MMWSRALSKKVFGGGSQEFLSANRALESSWNSMLARSLSTVPRSNYVLSSLADDSEKPSVVIPAFSRGNILLQTKSCIL